MWWKRKKKSRRDSLPSNGRIKYACSACGYEFGVPAKWVREFYPGGKEYHPGGKSYLSCPKCRETIELK